MPEDFSLNENRLRLAQARGYGPQTSEKIFRKFVSYCKMHGKRYKDWDAAWDYWLDGQSTFEKKPRVTGGGYA
jgi:hypothetical protein